MFDDAFSNVSHVAGFKLNVLVRVDNVTLNDCGYTTCCENAFQLRSGLRQLLKNENQHH